MPSPRAMKGVNSVTFQRLGRWEEPTMPQRYAPLSSEHLPETLEKIQPQKHFTQVGKRRKRKVY